MKSALLPWLLLAALGVSGAAGFFGFRFGASYATNKYEAAAARDEHIQKVTFDAAQKGAAAAIATIHVNSTVVKQTLQKEVVDRPVYHDCSNTAVGMSLINSALLGTVWSVPAGDSQLSTSGPAH